MVDLNTGKDSKKELVKDEEGNFVLNILSEKNQKFPSPLQPTLRLKITLPLFLSKLL